MKDKLGQIQRPSRPVVLVVGEAMVSPGGGGHMESKAHPKANSL